MLLPLNVIVPLPPVVRAFVPETTPLTVRALDELFVQVWLAPRFTFSAIVLDKTPPFMVMPAEEEVGAMVSVYPSKVKPKAVAVLLTVKAPTVMSEPSFMPTMVPGDVALEKTRSADAPGTAPVAGDVAAPDVNPDKVIEPGSETIKVKPGSIEDVNAVGNRDIGARGMGNWYSTDSEIKMGKTYADEIEKSTHSSPTRWLRNT